MHWWIKLLGMMMNDNTNSFSNMSAIHIIDVIYGLLIGPTKSKNISKSDTLEYNTK